MYLVFINSLFCFNAGWSFVSYLHHGHSMDDSISVRTTFFLLTFRCLGKDFWAEADARSFFWDATCQSKPLTLKIFEDVVLPSTHLPMCWMSRLPESDELVYFPDEGNETSRIVDRTGVILEKACIAVGKWSEILPSDPQVLNQLHTVTRILNGNDFQEDQPTSLFGGLGAAPIALSVVASSSSLESPDDSSSPFSSSSKVPDGAVIPYVALATDDKLSFWWLSWLIWLLI